MLPCLALILNVGYRQHNTLKQYWSWKWLCHSPFCPHVIIFLKHPSISHEWGRRGTPIGYWWESHGKRPLGRSRHRWVDNIRINLGEVDAVMWTGLVWLRIGTG
jgi:hypothetical protein